MSQKLRTFVKESRCFDVTRDIWLSEDVYFISERSIKLKLSDISYATTPIVERHQFRADCRIPKTFGKFVIRRHITVNFDESEEIPVDLSLSRRQAWITWATNFRYPTSSSVVVWNDNDDDVRTIYIPRKVFYVHGIRCWIDARSFPGLVDRECSARCLANIRQRTKRRVVLSGTRWRLPIWFSSDVDA